VFGVGLIGGSFALALKQAGCIGHVVGVGRGRANLERALELGAIDQIADDTPSALRGADLVLVAVPVQQTLPVLTAIAPCSPTPAAPSAMWWRRRAPTWV
jgi:prephenate dehydrogenase